MIKRELNLSEQLGLNSSAFIFGARGTGKTTLVREFLTSFPKAGWSSIEFDLLKTDVYERYLKHPHLFRLEVEEIIKTKGKILVFVDEVQRAPKILDEVHSLLESHKGNVRFLLSGSSARKLLRTGANLLAGRALTLKLFPLTSREYQASMNKTLLHGTIPGIVVENDTPEQSLRSYVSTYLREEIQMEAQLRRVDAFARFLEVAAQFHGEILNAVDIARSAGVSSQTVSSYIQILEDTLLGFRIPGWSTSAHKQLRTTPKFFFFDNGVANVLRGEIRIELSPVTSRFGKLFEAWIIQEAVRLNEYQNLDLKFSYWQTNSGAEVDLVVSRGAGQPLVGIEIKSTETPQSKDYSGLISFGEAHPQAKKWCFCRTPHAFSQSGVEFLPWQMGLEYLTKL